MERLQKVIASCGVASRRKAEELIKNGKVIVNGKVVRELGTKASFSDDILVEGKRIEREEKEYMGCTNTRTNTGILQITTQQR